MTQQAKRSPRPFRQTTVGATSIPPVSTGKKRKLPAFVAKQLEDLECAAEWYDQWSDPTGNSGLALSAAKGQNKTQLCQCCHEPYKQNRLKYGVPGNRPFDPPDFYCPGCFEHLNCRGIR